MFPRSRHKVQESRGSSDLSWSRSGQASREQHVNYLAHRPQPQTLVHVPHVGGISPHIHAYKTITDYPIWSRNKWKIVSEIIDSTSSNEFSASLTRLAIVVEATADTQLVTEKESNTS